LGAIAVLCLGVGLEKVWVWSKLCDGRMPLENMPHACSFYFSFEGSFVGSLRTDMQVITNLLILSMY
jgi:hypothetical protein